MSRPVAVVERLGAVVLLALAGCTAGHVNTVCRTEFAIEERERLLLVPVLVNTTIVPGVLDTGAQASAITEAAVTRLGLLSDPQHGSVMVGVGGEGTPQNDALVDRFELAGFDPGARHYAVIAVPLDGHGGEPLGALIGADLLSHFDIDLDIANKRLVLYDPDRCPQPFPDWQVAAVAVPLETSWGNGRLELIVKLDGQDVRAILDSGATSTVLDQPAAQKLGVTPEMLAGDPGSQGFGAAGVNFQRALHTFRSLEIGGAVYAAPRISVIDRPLRGADMLLGLDWLRDHRVLIAFRRRMLFIARAEGGG